MRYADQLTGKQANGCSDPWRNQHAAAEQETVAPAADVAVAQMNQQEG